MEPQPETQRTVRFGLFEADLLAAELRKQGRTIKLQEQPFQVLAMLLRRPGEVVTREELQQALWPSDTFVEFDQGLNTAVKKIRQALGDSAGNPRFVETVPRKGYRFIAPVSGAETPAAAASVAAPARHRHSVRVAALITLVVGSFAFWFFRTTKAPEPAPEPIPLTSYPGDESSPSFSPDGNQVAFQWEIPDKEKSHVYVKLIGASEPQRLTKNPAAEFGPAWSPDGRSIAFLRELSAKRQGVFLIPAIGGPERKLTDASWWGELEWHPGGEWLVLTDRNSETEPFALFLLSAKTGEKRRLTWPPPGSDGDRQSALSPDGHTLVFSRMFAGGRADLYLLELSEDLRPKGEPEPITFGTRFADDPAWSPDGKFILFTWGSIHNPGLWRMAIGGGKPGKPERLAFAGTGVRTPIISRQGRLVYAMHVYDADIWRLDLPAGQAKPPTRVVSSTRLDHTPQYSPDGKRIAFASDRSGSHEIWVCDRDGSSAVPLTSFGGPYTADPQWSPNGEWIAFASNAGGRFAVYVMRSGGGTPKRLTNSSATENVGGWSRDGKWIYFSSNRSGEFQIWKMPWGQAAAFGEAVQITRKGGGFASESADGRFAYYLKADAEITSLWRVPVSGGEEMQMVDKIWSHNFGLAHHGVYFIPEGTPTTVQFLNFATGKVTMIATLAGNPAYGFSVAPDERSLLFSQYEDHGSDLMLVENFH